MYEQFEFVVYIVFGFYVYLGCLNILICSCQLVYVWDLFLIVFCCGCEDQILLELCVFCEIIVGQELVEWIFQFDMWYDVVVFVLFNLVIEGYCLIVLKWYVKDFVVDLEIFVVMVWCVVELMWWMNWLMNVIMLRGWEVMQSVFYLYFYLVLRLENDGLVFFWYSGRGKGKK